MEQKVRGGSTSQLSNFEGCSATLEGCSTNFEGDTRTSSFEGGSATQNLSFEGGKNTPGSNFSKENLGCKYSQYEGIWDRGLVTPSAEIPKYTMIENNKSLPIENLHQMNYMALPSYTCNKKSLTGQCNHLQLKFPYLDRNEDVINSISL